MAGRTVSSSEVFRLRREGKNPCLIDVRTPGEFAGVHAEGARLVPLGDMDPAAVTAGLVQGEAVYLICKSGGRAAEACRRLEAAGWGNACVVEGGTEAWERAGLPVVRGVKGAWSMERQVRVGAGALVLVGLVLAWLVHPVFFGIPAFVGGGLVFAGVTDRCGMALVLAKMPWNRGRSVAGSR